MLKTWCSVFLKEYKLQSTVLQEQVTLPWSNVMNLIAVEWGDALFMGKIICTRDQIFICI